MTKWKFNKKNRYNRIKGIISIVNVKTRSSSERLKELFKRDGLTAEAIISAIEMSISTIAVPIMPRSGDGGSGPKPNQPTNQNFATKAFIKLANGRLDVAKKAL